jgi:predicted metalloprotease with PDZ domain
MRGIRVSLQILAFSLVAAGLTLPVGAAPPSGIDGLRIERHESEPLLGIYAEGDEDGVQVHEVIDDSAAEEAGLERGDVIVSLDGESVGDFGDLHQLVSQFGPGETVRIGYLRDGDEQSVRVEMGRRPPRIAVEIDRPLFIVSDETRGRIRGTMTLDEDDRLDEFYVCDGDECRFSTERIWYRMDCIESSCPTYRVNFWGRPMLGVHITEITEELREHFGADPDTGVLIAKVIEGSPAERAGVEVGDLIVAVEGRLIEESSDIKRALKGREGDVVEVEVIRDGRSVALNAELPQFDD